MVMTPEVGDDFIQWQPPAGDVRTLGLVHFSICPHLAPDGMPGNTLAEAEGMGRQHLRPGIRHRRPDGHQGSRRNHRGRVRRPLETVELIPRPTAPGQQSGAERRPPVQTSAPLGRIDLPLLSTA